MPSKPNKPFSLFKSNRSQASLLNSHEARSIQASPIDSPLHSPSFPHHSAQSYHHENEAYGRPYEPEEARYYHRGPPNTSQRQSPVDQPTIQFVRPHESGESPTTNEQYPDSYYQQAPPRSDKKKSSIFSFRNSSSASQPAETSNLNASRVPGRRLSVRKQAPPSYPTTDNLTQRWPAGAAAGRYTPEVNEREDGRGSPLHTRAAASISVIPPNTQAQHPASSYHQDQIQHPRVVQPVHAESSWHTAEKRSLQRTPTWEKAALTVQHQLPPIEQQGHHPPFRPNSSSGNSISGLSVSSRSAQDLAYYNYRSSQGSRPSSRQSYEPPSPTQPQSYPIVRTSEVEQQGTATVNHAQYMKGSMGPPPAQTPQTLRMESNQSNTQASGSGREGTNYQGFNQSSQGGPQTASQPPPQYSSQLGVNNQQGGNYRGAPQSSPMAPQSASDQGRSTPPPNRSRDDLASLDVAQLLARHDELQDKYRKVKKYYFEKDGQVQQLQNTLAHQRLSQSRTSLDDNEYQNRFSRLDGAINNLAFNIRKDWRSIPPWLAPCVNKDATTSVTKEMTAVGRACISRWLTEEVFNRCFHPAIEPGFSSQLKIVEKNLRRFAPPCPTEEEKEALLAKISHWRLTTIDGLHEMMASQQAAEYRESLTEELVEKLTESLAARLREPAPPEVHTGAIAIVELAVGIAANLPLESRDVFIEYVMPGTIVNESYMKIEGSLPPLTNPGEGATDSAENASIASTDVASPEDKEADRDSAKDIPVQQHGPVPPAQQQQMPQQQQHQKKKSMFGGFMSSSKKPAQETSRGSVSSQGGSSGGQGQSPAPKEERVRFAVFMSVEVRGKNTLIKAPVYI